MWQFIKDNQFLVGAATGSLAAFLLNLMVSYWRRDKRWLGYSVTSRNVVQSGPQKLSLTYDGKKITRLDSHTVIFRNIGNRPLGGLPIRLQCADSGTVLDYELSTPDGAAFKSLSDPTCITVTVDLLNPGETFSIGLTIADSSQTSSPKIIARAELLELREIGSGANTVDLLEALLPHMYLGGLILDLYKISSRRQR